MQVVWVSAAQEEQTGFGKPPARRRAAAEQLQQALADLANQQLLLRMPHGIFGPILCQRNVYTMLPLAI
jgi:hypothetical protein